MKYEGKIIKYIFFIIITGLLILAVYIISSDNKKIAAKIQEHPKIEKYKDKIIIGITNLDTLNPMLTKNKDVQYILKLIYEPLLDISDDFKLKSGIAEEYSKLDDKTYIIKLKEDKLFHDGEKLTAKDVEFTINALKHTWVDSIYHDNVKNIEDIIVIDEYTLKIYLSEETPYFEYKLVLPIIPKHQYSEKYEFIGEIPIGTGNFYVKEKTDEKIVLENKSAKTKEIDIIIYKRNADMYSDFAKHKIDLITTSNTDYEKYLGTMGYKSIKIPDRNYDYLLINQESALLKDKDLRTAINFAINRKEIIYNVYNNKYIEMYFPKDTETRSEYDPNEARKTLEQNGYILKNNYLYKKEKKISLNLSINGESENNRRVAEIIKENLKEIGININIINLSKVNYEYNLKNNYYDLILGESTLCLEPNYKEFFKFGNEEINNILKEIDNIENEKIKEEKIEELRNIVKEENPFIGLYVNTNTLLLNKELKGDFKANWYSIFYNVDTWYVVDK